MKVGKGLIRQLLSSVTFVLEDDFPVNTGDPDLSKYMRYGVLEDLDTVRHIRLGKFLGIEVSVTPLTWLGPFLFFLLGIFLNTLRPWTGLSATLYKTGIFVIGVEISTLLHALGHIIGGKLVRSPMDELLLTATRGVNIYLGDQNALPGFVHLGRALGGPLLNLFAATLVLRLETFTGSGFDTDLLAAIASTSLFFGLGAFAPLPSVDGQVIWREVFRWLARLRPRRVL